jgi:hypothetical protein
MQLMARFQRITQTSVLYQNCRDSVDCAWTVVSSTQAISQTLQHVRLPILIRVALSFNYTALKQTIANRLFNFRINHIHLQAQQETLQN